MNIDDLTHYEDLKKEWLQYDEETKKTEYLVFEERNNRINEYLDKAKYEFRQYFTQWNKFEFRENFNRIYASYNELKFEISFVEPNQSPIYEFGFSVIKSPRIDYKIPIIPTQKITLPKLFKHRDEPKSSDLLEQDIVQMRKEFLHWEDIKERIITMEFCYQCYKAQNTKPDYASMNKYSSFTELLEKKLARKK